MAFVKGPLLIKGEMLVPGRKVLHNKARKSANLKSQDILVGS